ncbi:MAG TPA: Rpp14/Pop5 family protein [Candidatus Saccharimonadales bacterium]|nr:Rpp14/Pop5 family protein [Candidatus Saccharimonadales bacterium]
MSKRYFMLRIDSNTQLTEEQLIGVIITSITKHFGEIGIASMNLRLIRYDREAAEAVVACERIMANELLTALALARDVDGISLSLVVIRISGTIKGLAKKK